MPSRKPHRIHASVIAADREVLRAVADLPDYTPLNMAYSAASLQVLEADLTAAEAAEARAERELEAARERVRLSGDAFHEAISGTKRQVLAQYGNDSLTVHAIGLKKRSEYRRPAPRATREG